MKPNSFCFKEYSTEEEKEDASREKYSLPGSIIVTFFEEPTSCLVFAFFYL